MSTTARWLVGSTLVGAAVFGGLIMWFWPVLVMLSDTGRTGSYRFGSESMAPTLSVGDVVRPLRLTAGGLGRGQVIAFSGPESVRVARIVGIGGDTVSMRSGHLVINGVPVGLHEAGKGPVLSDGTTTHLQLERLPGDAGTHRLLDAGPTDSDDVTSVRVPIGRLYVLGDNRDRAADSRFPTEQLGTGLLPVGRVIGIVDRVLWSGSFGERGRPIDQVANPNDQYQGTP